MRKWEESQRRKKFNTRIKNAKKNVDTGISKKSTPSISGKNQQISEIYSSQSSLSDYFYHEKHDLSQIPLYRLLKLNNLQQYAKVLISMGFGYDLNKLCTLPDKELEAIFNEIKVLPGHKTKLRELLFYIQQIIPSDKKEMSPRAQTSLAKARAIEEIDKSKSAKSMRTKRKSGIEPPKENFVALKNVGIDFFVSPTSKGEEKTTDEDIDKEIEDVMQYYKGMDESLVVAKKSLPIKKEEYKGFARLKEKKIQPEKEKNSQIASEKARKEWNSRNKPQKPNTSAKNPIIEGISSKLIETKEKPESKGDFDLNFNKVKEFYVSFDSGKMTSTIVNLDIEEMCHCLANVILKYLDFGIKYNSEIKREEDKYQREVAQIDNEYYSKLEMNKPAVKKKSSEEEDYEENFDSEDNREDENLPS